MRRKLSDAAWVLILGACGAPKPLAEPAPAFKITESFACPYPAHRGLKSVDADGSATLVIFDGLEGPPQSKSRRQKKLLSAADMGELSRIVAASDYKTFPERAESYPPKNEQTDACSHSLEITADGVTKTVSYRDGDVPQYLADLLKQIDLVIERGSWEADVYPWENR
jgi:hypothetical protein